MARASRAAAESNRSHVVEAASRLLRESGPHAVTVAASTGAAGLTAGGFYKQFASKDALVVEALELAAAQRRSGENVSSEAVDERSGTSSRDSTVDGYLTLDHRDSPGTGCPVSALVGDAARHPDTAFAAEYTKAVNDLIDLMAPGVARTQALADVAAMVGAITLARAVDDADLSADIIAAVHHRISAVGSSSGEAASSG